MKNASIASASLVLGTSLLAETSRPRIKGFTSNLRLDTVMPEWPGTPLDEDGLFMNQHHPWKPNYGQILKFMLEQNPQKGKKKKDTWSIPVIKDDRWLEDQEDKMVWFGHASFFIQLSGTRILIDPVFGKLPLQKRHSELPVAPEKLKNIHYILVSHTHYDHCDKDSIKVLTKNNPQAQILTGLNLDKVISKWTDNGIQTAGWYQRYNLTDGLQITFLPSRHWSNRGLFDVNTSLWGGFMIQNGARAIYYGGDSGYDSHFREIGELFPKIDVALIGAGAYAPTWFMGPNHQDPFDAVRAFHATGARTFIPFHFGTFDSADEPLGEPEEILTRLYAEGKICNTLKILKIGEPFSFNS